MTETAEKPKEKRKDWCVVVRIPNFPPQDPLRPMVYLSLPSERKAERAAKGLRLRMPEYQWSVEPMTSVEKSRMKYKPVTIKVMGYDFEVKLRGRRAAAPKS